MGAGKTFLTQGTTSATILCLTDLVLNWVCLPFSYRLRSSRTDESFKQRMVFSKTSSVVPHCFWPFCKSWSWPYGMANFENYLNVGTFRKQKSFKSWLYNLNESAKQHLECAVTLSLNGFSPFSSKPTFMEASSWIWVSRFGGRMSWEKTKLQLYFASLGQIENISTITRAGK